MIIDRRKTHFFSFITLAFLLPIIFLIGVIFNPQYPILSNSETQIFSTSRIFINNNQASQKLINSTKIVDGKLKFNLKTWQENDSIYLEIQPLVDIKIPEPLIYWQEGDNKPNEITENMTLLGSLSGKSKQIFKLPSIVLNQKGQLILYSQGYQEIIATFPVDMAKFKS